MDNFAKVFLFVLRCKISSFTSINPVKIVHQKRSLTWAHGSDFLSHISNVIKINFISRRENEITKFLSGSSNVFLTAARNRSIIFSFHRTPRAASIIISLSSARRQTRNSRLEKLTLFENILLVHLIMQKPLLIFSCQNQPDGIKHEGIINLGIIFRTHFVACN